MVLGQSSRGTKVFLRRAETSTLHYHQLCDFCRKYGSLRKPEFSGKIGSVLLTAEGAAAMLKRSRYFVGGNQVSVRPYRHSRKNDYTDNLASLRSSARRVTETNTGKLTIRVNALRGDESSELDDMCEDLASERDMESIPGITMEEGEVEGENGGERDDSQATYDTLVTGTSLPTRGFDSPPGYVSEKSEYAVEGERRGGGLKRDRDGSPVNQRIRIMRTVIVHTDRSRSRSRSQSSNRKLNSNSSSSSKDRIHATSDLNIHSDTTLLSASTDDGERVDKLNDEGLEGIEDKLGYEQSGCDGPPETPLPRSQPEGVGLDRRGHSGEQPTSVPPVVTTSSPSSPSSELGRGSSAAADCTPAPSIIPSPSKPSSPCWLSVTPQAKPVYVYEGKVIEVSCADLEQAAFALKGVDMCRLLTFPSCSPPPRTLQFPKCFSTRTPNPSS